MSWFENKHALVTGGGRGIGEAVAKILADKGAKVTIVGRDAGRLAATADKLGASYRAVDVTDREQIATEFAAAAAEHGNIAILVNNAGIADSRPFPKMDDALWDKLIAVNLTGVYNCSRAVVDGMLEAGEGRIINIASVAGLTGAPYISAYCASKHGVIGLTRALAAEFAMRNITVNAVCPGYVDTDMADQAIRNVMDKTGRSRDEALAEIVKMNAHGRLVTPEEVADTVAWLCRQGSVNGHAVPIAGGGLS